VSIALIGMPGAGKSTVGAALARELGVDFLDTDLMIEQDAGQLITEIFAQKGEANFRYLEEEATALALNTAGVVALGGGAILSEKVRTMLEGHQVVWLDNSLTTLFDRIKRYSHRPLLKNASVDDVREVALQRLATYQEVATWVVDGEQDVDEIVKEIITLTRQTEVIKVRSENPYHVLIGKGGFPFSSMRLASVNTTVIFHPHVLADHAANVASTMPGGVAVEVPDGEQAKTVSTLESCWSRLAELGVTRSDAIIGLGGGSTTDLAGFVAATYLRGVKYGSIPTTVLGMADAAVGGKTGINLPQGKNLVGAFHEPEFVICDLELLRGLPVEEVRSGLGEIIKCGFIADPVILQRAETSPTELCDVTSDSFAEVLKQAIQVKADVVSRDFREQDAGDVVGRAALNYGHTLGHAIEKQENYTWSHGEAVSVGMVYAAEVAQRLGLIPVEIVDQHRAILSSVGLPISYSSAKFSQLRETMSRDKKARGSSLKFVLLEGIGKTTIVADIDEDILADAYKAIAE